MQHILIIGAGRAATSLINYLLSHARQEDWYITLAERNLEMAKAKTNGSERIDVVEFNVSNASLLKELVENHDLVISMLPVSLHFPVACVCAQLGKHFLTASYLKDDIKSLSDEFKKANKLAVMEMGLDPGIDHMSAMKMLNELREKKYDLTGFETFTGGLIADESCQDNPWKYKFTWNPRNVVLAGQGSCKFIKEGKYKYIPYHKVYRRTETIHIPNYGYFEGYANRDSLSYLDVYKLRGSIKTLYRGTLRRPGYCAAWNVFVQLGATDDTYEMENVSGMTHRQFINSFLYYNPHDSIELKLAHYLNLDVGNGIMFNLKWLGIFDDELVGLNQGTPAQILEHILKKKWTLNPNDKDMVVMWHKFNFIAENQPRQIESSMVVIGDNPVNTALSKTVGLPLAIMTKLILQQKIKLSGVHIPIQKAIYEPVLKELISTTDLKFTEREIDLTSH